ncbi:MAG: zinc-ribbon domain-containing protein, partial [Polyangiaceae bacterium]|nr:zinc-ribbon domain-containing protein [Polyangiaceae bacterium]
MFKVECPNCSAPYQVDERRVPASGLKMRCPKCGHAFVVDPPGQSAPATGAASVPGAPRRKANQPATIGMPSGRAPVADLPALASGLPAALGGAPRGKAEARKEPPRPVPKPPAAADDGAEAELDLPTLGERLHGGRPAADLGESGGRQVAAEARRPHEHAESERYLPSVRGLGRGGSSPAATPRASFDAETRPGLRGPSGRAREYDGEMDLGLPLVVPSPGTGACGPTAAEPVSAPPPRPDSMAWSREPEPLSPGADVSEPAGMDLDLPVPSGGLDLPSLRTPADDLNAATFQDLSFAEDLPSPTFDSPASARDLQSPAFDLPALASDLPSLASDLPSLASDLPSLASDLPSPTFDLPSPVADLPSPSSDLTPARPGLPARPDVARAGLPAMPPRPAARAGLPTPAAALPAVAADSALRAPPPPRGLQKPPPRPGRRPPPPARPQGVDAPEAPAPAVALDERSAGDEFDPFAVGAPEVVPTPPEADGPLAEPQEIPDGFASMDVDLGSMEGPERLASAPEDAVASASPLVRQAGGGTSFGEVNLEGALDGALPAASMPPVAQAADDDMEFGAIPQETETAAPPPSEPAAGALAAAEETAEQRASRRHRRVAVLGAVLGALALGGAALALVPSLGPYGIYFLTDQLRRGEYQKVLAAEVRSARLALGRDSRASAEEAMRHVERTLRGYRRVRGLAAYGAFVGELIELRYREESAVKARADVMLDEQAGTADTPYLNLAGATRAAAEGRLALARQRLARVGQADAVLDALVVRGELELNAGEPKAAVEYFSRAAQRDGSARTAFGLARAQFALGNAAEAQAQAKLTLERNPDHIGARILLARLGWASKRDDVAALSLLEQALKLRDRASALELVDAYTLIGDIHLDLSRVSLAEAAFGEALRVRPQAAR